MPTLYVSDLDGTLLDRDQRVSEQTATIINELVAQGMLFTVATARSTPSARQVLADLDLRVPVVYMNGVLIVDPMTNAPLRRNVLPPDVARRLIRAHLEVGLTPFVYTLDAAGRYHAYYLGTTNACQRDYVDRRRAVGDDRFAVVPDLAAAIDGDVLSLSTVEPPHLMVQLHQRLATDPLLYCHFDHDIYMSGFHWLTIGHIDANKGDGVRIVKELVGADRVVCFGDNLNDLAMFEVADEAYAMADAPDGLRDIAHGTIGSNVDHAVAAYLRDAWPAAA